MRKINMRRMLRFGVVLCALCGLLTVSAFAGGTDYGYRQLDDRLQELYTILAEGLAEKAESIRIDQEHSANELSEVMTMLRADHPEFFWFDGAYSATDYKNSVTNEFLYRVVAPQYVHDSDEEQAAFDQAVDDILEVIPRDASDYDIALYLHDALIDRITYDLDYGDEQTAYSVLVDGVGVCAGYARAYQYLLNECGIDAWTVEGWSVPKDGTEWIAHAWNLVWLDGDCYYTDVTWDDQKSSIYHAYFNRSLEDMDEGHRLDAVFETAVPSCGHDGMDYFTHYGNQDGIITADSATTAQEVIAAALKSGGHAFVRIWFENDDVNQFNSWLYSDTDGNGKPLYHDVMLGVNVVGPGQSVGLEEMYMDREFRLEVYPSTDAPYGWADTPFTFDETGREDFPDGFSGDYTVSGTTLTARVSYEGVLDREETYEAWVGFYAADGRLLGMDMVTLELDRWCQGELEADCPRSFDTCQVFIVDSDSAPLCEVLGLLDN